MPNTRDRKIFKENSFQGREPNYVFCISHIRYVEFIATGVSKTTLLEGPLLPEYQSNDNKSCLVLLAMCSVRFSSLHGFNRPFLLVDMGISSRRPLATACKNK